MSRAHLRLIAAILVLGIVAAGVIGMNHAWTNYLKPSLRASEEIRELESQPPERIDVGLREFAEAMELMRDGKVEEAHSQLGELVRTYTDSAAHASARRILGEVHMDRLLSDVRTPGKIDYVVQGGDSLNKIAAQQKTTVDYIIQVNGLQGINLQKGEQLIVCELDFSVNVNLSEKTLVLLRDGKVFKEYPIRESRGVRPADTTLERRIAFDPARNRAVALGQDGYVGSEKSLLCGKGIGLLPFTEANRDDLELSGIFLDVADIEELYTVLRTGTQVLIRQ